MPTLARRLPHALVLLGLAAALGALALLARALPGGGAGGMEDLGDVAGGLLLAAAAGALCGGGLLAMRLRDAAYLPRALAILALAGCLLGGLAAFWLAAVGAGAGNMLLAGATMALVLVALMGIATGGAYLKAV